MAAIRDPNAPTLSSPAAAWCDAIEIIYASAITAINCTPGLLAAEANTNFIS